MNSKEICKEEKCTGCCACYNICPIQCITMEEDKLGYIKPKIDMNKCIQCNLCRKTCPINNESRARMSKDAYAVWNLNEGDRKDSASGGVATVLSRFIIKKNGVVFGSKVDDNLNIIHDCAKTDLDIDKFKGSKYVQSYIGNTYKKVKENLEKGKYVAFIGTPCQVNGLNFYLSKSYDKLLTVDLICHGVPPQKYLKEHVNNITKDKKKTITNLRFRGQNDYMLTLFSGNEIVYKQTRECDLYFRGFMNGLFFRESCYSCKYSNPKRVSDITIGDFWGLGEERKFDRRGISRISVVLPNTEKGESFFQDCKKNLFFEKRTVDEAVNGNYNLQKPSVKHYKYDEFKKAYIDYGFEKAANLCLSKEIRKDKVRNKMRSIKIKIKSIIKPIIGIFIKKYRLK